MTEKSAIREDMEQALLDTIDDLDVKTLVGTLKAAREMDLNEMSDRDVANWFKDVVDSFFAPDRRADGNGHLEDVIGDRARCGICGWLDDLDESELTPEQIYYHQDSFA